MQRILSILDTRFASSSERLAVSSLYVKTLDLVIVSVGDVEIPIVPSDSQCVLQADVAADSVNVAKIEQCAGYADEGFDFFKMIIINTDKTTLP